MSELKRVDPSKLRRLPATELRWTCDLAQFAFETTQDLPELSGLMGQTRAEKAIEFGVGIQREGYNLYVLGPPGLGKRTVIKGHLEPQAKREPRPSDWCYVNNFRDEDCPAALEFPAGQGRQFVDDMDQLVEDLQSAIPAALEGEEHLQKIEEAEQQFQDEHAKSLSELAQEAHSSGLEMIRTPTGVALAPIHDGKVIAPEEFEKLPEDQKKAIETAVEALQPKLEAIIQKLPNLRRLVRQKVKELNQQVARRVIEQLMLPLKQKYAEAAKVLAFLEAVEADVIENADAFLPPAEGVPPMMMAKAAPPSFDPYMVNLLVDNTDTTGAPVVYEDSPYFHNLVGRVEHETQMGSLVTHFSLIKAGCLHRANGGYLVLQARDVLLQPFAWEALKRALRSGCIQIESLGAALSLISTVSLQPEPIPLNLKVVLLGDRLLYYLLQEYDPDFDELFKVAVDFSESTDRNPQNLQLYAQMLGTLAKTEKTRPLERAAVALMIEQAARHMEDREKLSMHMRTTADLLRESDYWAGVKGADVITAEHVREAIEQRVYRSDRIRERVHEEIRRGTLLVDLKGERVGQINGLSVISVGNFAFGRPSRITATARLGRGKVVDIEREVELGGALHSKGVLILTSLLAARYARDYPLSLSASLVFEQSYGIVDGDSASVAELCALLSTLAEIPIQQGLAITGSLNQHGQAQPIGGVNEKIEGFFDVCRSTGLTGEQGVLIPASNEKHLMLRSDVLDAVAAGQFSVYSYDTIEEAVELLTGVEAGVRDAQGAYPGDTVNGRVDRRLREFAEWQRAFADAENTGTATPDAGGAA